MARKFSSGIAFSTALEEPIIKEIRYASLLHDFGKVGVREEVLVKAHKLYPAQMDVVLRLAGRHE